MDGDRFSVSRWIKNILGDRENERRENERGGHCGHHP